MSTSHEKKPRPLRPAGKSIIAPPPRAAFSGRAKAAADQYADESMPVKSAELESSKVSPSYADESEAAATKDKDRRIAELEKEMATMTKEFERELNGLSHKLTDESETASFWQQKHSTLNQTWLETDTELRVLRQEVITVHEMREDRERDMKTRISSLTLDRDGFRDAYNEAMGELRVKEDMIKSLQGQVRGLKSFVSTNSKMDEQVADEAFGERMQRLGNGLQNWVITNFRRVKIDIAKADDKTKEKLLQLVPTYETLISPSKVYMIQSLISRLLVNHVFNTCFVGLPEGVAHQITSLEEKLRAFGSVESMNQWRSSTLAILRRGATSQLQRDTESIIECIVSHFNEVMDAIGDIKRSDARDTSLKSLISSSIELSRLLRVQKAVFTLEMPIIEDHQQTMFDPSTMEDIGGEDEDTLCEREIRCVVFPGIIKTGDENGERSHLRNVVAKIRVLCAPD